jgi:hypothetical protein
MPHASLKLIPGVDQTRTEALNEAALWESNLIRFMPDRQGQGLPQKLGGWTQFISTRTWDTVRALHAWADTNTNNYLTIGAENSLFSSNVPTQAIRLSPQYYTANISVSVSTTSGSSNVTISDTGSNITSFDSIYISTPISVGGVILSGYYNTKAVGANSYVVVAKNIIGNLTPATNTLSVTTIATTGVGPYTVTVVHTAGSTVTVGATVTFTGAGSFAGPYTVLTSSSGTFTFSTSTNLGSASSGTFVASALTGGAVPTFTSSTSTPTITVTLADHGYIVGSTFAALAPTTVGGSVIYGNYLVTSVISSNQFTITAVNAPTNILTITSASWLASVATIGINESTVIPVGTSVVIAGMTPAGYNGTYTVTASSAGSFSYALVSNPGTATVFGTATAAAVTVSMNGGLAQIIYFLGQTAIATPTGYGSGGYGDGGYGTGVTYTGTGRVYTGAGIVGGGVNATVTLGTNVYVTPGSIVSVTSTHFTGTYTVLTATTGGTFTFASTAVFTDTGATIAVTTWGFQMPVSTDKDWSLDNWGEYLIASPLGGEIFYWNPNDANGHTVVVPNAPLVNEGCFVAMPERQIVAYGSTFTGFQDPLLVRWCDVGNFTSWVGTVVNQAGSYRIPKGSKIVGGIQGPQQGLIWTDLGLWAMQYINLPLVYSFNEIASGCGLVGRKAMGTLAGTVYWMSQSQFFRLSGNGVEPVQCPIGDVIFQDIDTSYWQNVRCAPNSQFGEIAWYYPTLGSNGVPTKYAKYNALLNQWDFGTLTRTAWIDQSIFGPPIGAGGDLNIYQHETSNDANGAAINSSFQTGYFAVQDGDLKTFVDQVWPDMKWGLYDQSQNATVTITFFTADYPGDTPKSYSYTVNQTTQFVTPRLRARLVAIKIESTDLGSFWRVGNIRYRYQPDGKF